MVFPVQFYMLQSIMVRSQMELMMTPWWLW
ncbi:hypothetical protein AWB81_01848 [Caballeronia arationis]|nr:hypothetical protein AWB81_01848 [Caballeronia arationis]